MYRDKRQEMEAPIAGSAVHQTLEWRRVENVRDTGDRLDEHRAQCALCNANDQSVQCGAVQRATDTEPVLGSAKLGIDHTDL